MQTPYSEFAQSIVNLFIPISDFFQSIGIPFGPIAWMFIIAVTPLFLIIVLLVVRGRRGSGSADVAAKLTWRWSQRFSPKQIHVPLCPFPGRQWTTMASSGIPGGCARHFKGHSDPSYCRERADFFTTNSDS